MDDNEKNLIDENKEALDRTIDREDVIEKNMEDGGTRKKVSKKKFRDRMNVWMIAFFVLLGIIIGTMVFLYTRVNGERESKYAGKPTVEVSTQAGEEPVFQVQLTKAQTNELINYYLEEYLGSSKIKYEFTLANKAMLKGNFSLLGHDIAFYVYFEPAVLENGDVELKASSISIGTLNLPVSELLKYVAKAYKMPDWVEVVPKEELISIHLHEWKQKNGMYVEAEKIDLIDDIITFNVFLPSSTEESEK